MVTFFGTIKKNIKTGFATLFSFLIKKGRRKGGKNNQFVVHISPKKVTKIILQTKYQKTLKFLV